ncbi:MAG: ribokinase, partial [Bacteroidales bacterium]|nr:ribokinase [Bacteroidales bacterium]
MTKKILIVGSSNTDLVVKTDHIPAPGETILGEDCIMAAGGKGANQAVAAARLGGDVAFIASVGDDMFGKQSLENFAREKMDCSHIKTVPGASSGIALICVDKDGENSIVVAPGTNYMLKPEDVSEDVIPADGFVLMQLEIPIETIESVAAKAKAKGA